MVDAAPADHDKADAATDGPGFGGPRDAWWKAAIREAGDRGSATVEAEHLLLGIASQKSSPVRVILDRHGLDYAAIDAALAAERQLSLAAAGITDITFPAPSPKKLRGGRPNAGGSLKDAMGRLRQQMRQRRGRPTEADVLAAALTADFGTVARLLTLAHVDRDALLADLQPS